MDRQDVALVTDQPLVAEALTRALERSPDLRLAGHYTHLVAAYDDWILGAPHVAVIDRSSLGADCLASLHAISQSTDVRVLVLARRPTLEFTQLVLQAGAAGVAASPTSAELLVAVRDILAGDLAIPAEMRERVQNRSLRGTVLPYLSLTRRERQIASLTAVGREAQEIAQALMISVATVRKHINHVHEKLGVRKRSELLRVLLQIGVLDPDQVTASTQHADPADDFTMPADLTS